MEALDRAGQVGRGILPGHAGAAGAGVLMSSGQGGDRAVGAKTTRPQTRARLRHVSSCVCAHCAAARAEHERQLNDPRTRRATALLTTDMLNSTHDAMIRFFTTHRIVRHRGKPEELQVSTPWLHHLDAFTLHGAMRRLLRESPLHGRIAVAYFYENKTQAEIGESEYMHQTAVGDYLKDCGVYLAKLYLGIERQPTVKRLN